MVDELGRSLLSFVLLTVVGGILGAILQHRSWTYKWSLESKDKRLSIARDVYQEVSRLMDKRLFRSKQLHIWLRRNNSERIEFSVSNYRSVIFELNESINRNLAMLEIYFGKEIRSSFDFGVGRMFVEA